MFTDQNLLTESKTLTSFFRISRFKL